jgi:hypothetical protein
LERVLEYIVRLFEESRLVVVDFFGHTALAFNYEVDVRGRLIFLEEVRATDLVYRFERVDYGLQLRGWHLLESWE